MLADLAIEITGAALLGYVLILLFPLIGGVIGGVPIGLFQSYVLRRNFRDSGSWMPLTIAGFAAAWLAAAGVAALLFVAPDGLSAWRAFLSFAIATPIAGWVQARQMRRWNMQTMRWVIATAAGWSGFIAVEIFFPRALAGVNEAAGVLVSHIAGYSVASNVGAALLGSLIAGAITGAALATMLPSQRTAGLSITRSS